MILTILKKNSQLEGLSHILWKIKKMFQTTNQYTFIQAKLEFPAHLRHTNVDGGFVEFPRDGKPRKKRAIFLGRFFFGLPTWNCYQNIIHYLWFQKSIYRENAIKTNIIQYLWFPSVSSPSSRHLSAAGQSVWAPPSSSWPNDHYQNSSNKGVYYIVYIYIIQIYVVYCGILCIYLHFCIVASGRFCPCSLARSLCLLISK